MFWLRACCLLVLAALTGCAGLGPVSPPAPDSRFRELARLVGTDPESGPGFAAELAAYRAEGPNRGIHTAGHQLLRCRKEGVGTAGVQGCSSHQSVISGDRASHSALAPLCSAIDRLN